MTDHEIVEAIKTITKALKAEQDLAETYRSAWQSQKDMCDQLSCDVTRLENERDRLREQLSPSWDGTVQTVLLNGKFVNGDEVKANDGTDDSDGYIEDGGARNAH